MSPNIQGYSLKATLECILCRDLYRKLTVQSSIGSDYRLVASIFLRFGEVIAEYFVYKKLFGFPPFCFHYLFMKVFQFQLKTKITSNKLNEKKSEHPFVKCGLHYQI